MKRLILFALIFCLFFSIKVFGKSEKAMITNMITDKTPKIITNIFLLINSITDKLPINLSSSEGEYAEIIEKESSFYSEKTETMLYPFKKNGLWGYMDENGSIKIEASFKSASEFSEGLARISDNNEKYGYIDLNGNIVIPCKYYYADNFSNGFAVVQQRKYLKNEYYHITDLDGPFIFIDKSGNNIFNEEYVLAKSFSEGYAQVSTVDGKSTYINQKGEKITSLDFFYTNKFEDGFAIVKIKNVGFAVINKEFEPLYLNDYNNVYGTKGGYIISCKQGKYGVIDTKGNVIIDFQYDYLSEYNDGLFIFRSNDSGGSGYIDIENNVIIPVKMFNTLGDFKNGLAIVSKKDEREYFGVINKNAEYIINPEYDNIRCLGDKLYMCLRNSNEIKYFDSTGKEIIPH